MSQGHQLLTEIYISKELSQLKSKWGKDKEDDFEECVQSTFVEMYAKPESFILELHEKGTLKWYIVRIMWNKVRRPKKRNQYKEVLSDFSDVCHELADEHYDRESEIQQEQIALKVKEAVKQMTWYEQGILQAYQKLGSYRAVTEWSGIPTTSVFKTIQEVKRKLKKVI